MYPQRMKWIYAHPNKNTSLLCSWGKEKKKNDTDIICFKIISTNLMPEFSSEQDRKQGELAIIAMPIRWCSDLK